MKGNNMRGKQSGMSLVGFIVGLIVACFFAYMAMVIGPAYSESFGVQKAMDFVAKNTSPTFADKDAIEKMLDKQFNVGYVENVTGKQVQLIRSKSGNKIVMDYEVRKGFVYNIDFAIKFKHEAMLGGGGGKSGD